MDDIDAKAQQLLPQWPDLTKRAKPLPVYRHQNMLTALAFQLIDQSTAGGDHQRVVSCLDEVTGKLNGAALDTACIQLGQYLYDSQGASPSKTPQAIQKDRAIA